MNVTVEKGDGVDVQALADQVAEKSTVKIRAEIVRFMEDDSIAN